MRERTPSADDTPTRAPPTLPKEAASADVVGSKAANSSAEVLCTTPKSTNKMVASTHNLEELGVSHPASASNESQQEKHGQTYKSAHSAQTAQDKRSRLSNVINNLRKKVPEPKAEVQKVEEDRNSVERKLHTLENYVMTVLNGVIKDEEKSKIGNIDRDADNVGKHVDNVDGKCASVGEEPAAPESAGRDLRKPSESEVEGASLNTANAESAVGERDVEDTVRIGENDDKCDVEDEKIPNIGKCESSKTDADQSGEREGVVIGVGNVKGSVETQEDVGNSEEVERCGGVVEGSVDEVHGERDIVSVSTSAANLCNTECEGSEVHRVSLSVSKAEGRVEKVENRVTRKSPRKLNRDNTSAKLDAVEAVKAARNVDKDTGIVERACSSSAKIVEAGMSDSQMVKLDVKIAEERIETQRDEVKDSERMELVTICRELLNDLLNDINHLIDENSVEDEKSDASQKTPQSSQSNSESPEPSTTSLHCSLPLEKVAPILQSCQSPNDQPSNQKTPSKPPSPITRHLCLYCDRKFLSISLRQRHTERVHQLGGGRRSERNSRKPSQNCQFCSEKCGDSLDGLFQHMVGSHADKYHACVQCTTRYVTRDALVSHMSETHDTILERTYQADKGKDASSKEAPLKVESPKDHPGSSKEKRPDDDVESRRESTPPKQMIKDAFSNPGSPDFDSSFYSSVSCNIRENLLHHLDGKLQPSTTSPSSESKQSFYEHSANQIQFPIDISLTAATPVYSKEYSTEDYDNSSEYAQKPGKTRTHPRRVSFEKYNFPRKYDGKEQWTCSIKDLSKFDISTQLSLRKKQQLLKERMTLSRLSQMPLLSPTKSDSGSCASQQQIGQTDLGLRQASEVGSEFGANRVGEDKVDGEASMSGKLIKDKMEKCPMRSLIDNASAARDPTATTLIPSDRQKSDSASKCSELRCEASSSKATDFSAEFASFMRLRKWEDSGAEGSKLQEMAYAELTGEWSRPRIYVCGACAVRHVTLKEMEEHKATSHPNVWCSHFEFSGDQRELYKYLFLPGRSVPTAMAKNALLLDKICTKCMKNCSTLAELHRHMLECGGDQSWLLGLFGNGKKKCKWRPFGSRSRRRRQRGMKRNIQNSQSPRVNLTKERPSSGPRVRPSDRESIQKMLANLPPKRRSRKVLQDTMTRSQGTLRNVQSKSRPRLAAETSSAVLSRNKAVLKNKLIKNAKSFKRNRHRIDNITAVIESVVQNSGAENDDEESVEDPVKTDQIIETPVKTPKSVDLGNKSKVSKSVRVLSKKKNVKTKDSTIANIEHPIKREESAAGKTAKDKTASKSIPLVKTSLAKASRNSSPANSLAKSSAKAVKNTAAKYNDKNADDKTKTYENTAETKSQAVETDASVEPTSSFSRRKRKGKRIIDPLASLNASIKAKSQLRTNDGKFCRNPGEKLMMKKSKLHPRPVMKTRSGIGHFVTRSTLRTLKKTRNRATKRATKRTTRLSSDSERMPTLEPAVLEPADAEKTGNDLPVLSPVNSGLETKSASCSPEIAKSGKNASEKSLEELIERSVVAVTDVRSKDSQLKESEKKQDKCGKKKKSVVGKKATERNEAVVAGGADETIDEVVSSESPPVRTTAQTKQIRSRSKKSVARKKTVPSPDKNSSNTGNSDARDNNVNRSVIDADNAVSGSKTKVGSVPKARHRGKTKQVRVRVERISECKDSGVRETLGIGSKLSGSDKALEDSVEKREASKPPEQGEKTNLLTKLGLKVWDKELKRGRRKPVPKVTVTVGRSRRRRDRAVDSEKVLGSIPGRRMMIPRAQKMKDKFAGRRKSTRNIPKKAVSIGEMDDDETVEETQFSDGISTEEDVLSSKSSREASPARSDHSTNDEKEETFTDNDKAQVSDSKSLDTLDLIAAEADMTRTKDVTEAKNTYVKLPKRSNGLGKRRGRIKAKLAEPANEITPLLVSEKEILPMVDASTHPDISDVSEADPTLKTNLETDMDKTSSEEAVPTDLVNLSLEHLQLESSNSNVDSGKENSSETPVNVPKLKVARPKKSKGVRRERGNKRTLNNVIGILTEGVNIPVEIQQSVVLTVQTAVDSANPGSLVQDNGQQINERDNVSSGMPDPDKSDKSAPDSESPFDRPAVSGDTNVQPCEKVNTDQTMLSKLTSGAFGKTCSSNSLQIPAPIFKEADQKTETSREQPSNDIILDLTRRKPKGKGSFLEKIVSKIAKQKDALLEGDVGSLLDNAADELTSILDEVSPNLTESTENLNAMDEKNDADRNKNAKQSEGTSNVENTETPKTMCVKVSHESAKLQDSAHFGCETSKELNDHTPIRSMQTEDVTSSEPMDLEMTPDLRENTREMLPKTKAKSKKRSLEANSPKKNKRKSVEAEEVDEESSMEEELCLAEIMKLIQKPSGADKITVDKLDVPVVMDDLEEKKRPGKRKTTIEHKLQSSSANSDAECTSANDKVSEPENIGAAKKPKRKPYKKKSLADEHLPLSDENDEEKQSSDRPELQDQMNLDAGVIEKTPETVEQSPTLRRRLSKRKSITSDSELIGNEEQTITNCEPTNKRGPKRKSLVNKNSEVAAQMPSQVQSAEESTQNEERDDGLLPDALDIVQTPKRKSSKRKSLISDASELLGDDEEMPEDDKTLRTSEMTQSSCRVPKKKSIDGSQQEILKLSMELSESSGTTESIASSQIRTRKSSKRKSFSIDDSDASHHERENSTDNLEGSTTTVSVEKSKRSPKKKSLLDEHLDLDDEIPAQELLSELKTPNILDPPEKPEETELVQTSKKRKSRNKSLIDQQLVVNANSEPADNVPVELLAAFKIPEDGGVFQTTRRRSLKKKSVPDEHSAGPTAGHVEISGNPNDTDVTKSDRIQTSRRKPNKKKSPADKELVDSKQVSESSESEQDTTDKTESSDAPDSETSDVSTFPKRRSSKRKPYTEKPHFVVPNDSSSQGNVLEGTVKPLSDEIANKRTPKRKSLLDRNLDLSDLQEQTQIPVADKECESDNSEREHTPKREAKRKKSLVEKCSQDTKEVESPISMEIKNVKDGNTEEAIEDYVSTEIVDSMKNTEEPSLMEQLQEDVPDEREMYTPVENETIEDDSMENDDQSKDGIQVPKKRPPGNFAVVHTKSGEILIVEKKKKLTKEAARFFCDVCDSSFTRNSSLKKHNLSQSHQIQMVKFGREQDKETTDNENNDNVDEIIRSVSEYTEHRGEHSGNVDSEDITNTLLEVQTPLNDSEKELESLDGLMDSGLRYNTSISSEMDESCTGSSIHFEIPKSSVTPQISEEEALEEELLDEEICKITENMTHDDYVLTDHVSPDVAVASTPVEAPNKKSTQKPKKKIVKPKSKKLNLADEHLDLNTPEPSLEAVLPVVHCNDQTISDICLEETSCSSSKITSLSIQGTSHELELEDTPKSNNLSHQHLDLNTSSKALDVSLGFGLHVLDEMVDEEVNRVIPLSSDDNLEGNVNDEKVDVDASRNRKSSRTKRNQSKENFEEPDKPVRKTRRDKSSATKLKLESEQLNQIVPPVDQLDTDQLNSPTKRRSRGKVSKQRSESENSKEISLALSNDLSYEQPDLDLSDISNTKEPICTPISIYPSSTFSDQEISSTIDGDGQLKSSSSIQVPTPITVSSNITDDLLNLDFPSFVSEDNTDIIEKHLVPDSIDTIDDSSMSEKPLADILKISESKATEPSQKPERFLDLEDETDLLAEVLQDSATKSIDLLVKPQIFLNLEAESVPLDNVLQNSASPIVDQEQNSQSFLDFEEDNVPLDTVLKDSASKSMDLVQKLQSFLNLEEENGNSTSSFADRPLSELLSKVTDISDASVNKAVDAELALDFSNITEKLVATETLVGDTNNSIVTEFDSDENSMDTSMSVDIQKLLNNPQFSEDKKADSQSLSDSELAGNDLSQSYTNKDKIYDNKCDDFRRQKKPMVDVHLSALDVVGIEVAEGPLSQRNPISSAAIEEMPENQAVVEKNMNDLETVQQYMPSKAIPTEDRSPSKKSTRNNNSANKENSQKSRTVKVKSRRKLAKNVPHNTSSGSENSDDESTSESQNKNKIVKSVFGRVFAGERVEKVDKVKEVLDDWDSRSEDGSQKRDYESVQEDIIDASVSSSVNDSKQKDDYCETNNHRSLSVSGDDSSSPKTKRRVLHNKKRNRSKAKMNNPGESSMGSQSQTRNESSCRQAKSRNPSESQKQTEDANTSNTSVTSISPLDVILPTSRCRQSKKRAEERISKAFEEESLTATDSRGRIKKTSPKSRETSYGLRNQSKQVYNTVEENDSDSLADEQLTDNFPSLETQQPATDPEMEQHPLTKKSPGKAASNSRNKTPGSRKTKKKSTNDWNDYTDKYKPAKSTLKDVEYSTQSDDDSAPSKLFPGINTEITSRNFLENMEPPSSPALSSIARSSVRNRSPTPDRNSQSSQGSEDEEDLAHGRISPLFVCNSPDSSMDSVSNNSNDVDVAVVPRKRSSSEFSGEKVFIRSPLSGQQDRSEMVTIAPTDAIEDNALDVPQEAAPQKSRQGKVLNFDEELFVECCSRLKATTVNELRGAKKIKLDHSDAFHRREEQGGYRTTRDRWRDVESQNSLGSLLESVNQLLGEEVYSNTEKDYAKRNRNLRSENSSRSGSPDADVSRPDNLGYEDSLDVAFEHNNKLRDKIQQRMRESENLIASTFGQRNVSFDAERDQNRPSYDAIRVRHEDTNVSNSNMSNGTNYNDSMEDRHVANEQHQQSGRHVVADSSGFKNKMNTALGGLLDKALSNLLHNNGKHDHNGSTPMKVLAELACARAPTSTIPEATEEKTSIKIAPAAREFVPEKSTPTTLAKKVRNPIKELFERKKEINDRKHSAKSKSEAALKELNIQRQRKTKKNRRRQEFPLVRKNQHGGMVERKKRRDGFDRKEECMSEKIKDVYDFDEEESQIETSSNTVIPYRSKIEKSYEISCLRTNEVDVASLMSKAIDETLGKGKERDVLGRKLETMIDQKFKEIEKFAPKTKGALKAFQSEDKQEVTGPMDDFIQRKQRSKRNSESGKHPKCKRKSRNPKKKSRHAWYENDSSDEFRTAAKTEDIGVGISKSQRTCSKGKQNLFAELSTSSESEFEEGDVDIDAKKKPEKRSTKKTVVDLAESDIQKSKPEDVDNNKEDDVGGEVDALENIDDIDYSAKKKKNRNDSETKKSESEMSDHPLVIDERRESDEQRNSDEDADADACPYDRSFELDDLYREDSSLAGSEPEESAQQDNSECIPDNSSAKNNKAQLDKTAPNILRTKYLEENELIPLEDALDMLDQSENLDSISEKASEKWSTLAPQTEEVRVSAGSSGEILENQEELEKHQEQAEDEIDAQEEDLEELPEKLSSNEKPQKESENLPLHVFLSRKVQESKKRKQQQLKKLQEEQERILIDFQPTRRQRKCAIGKQGLLAEISSSDEESYLRDIYKKSLEKSEPEKPRKQKRESKEKRKERYIEKKHEQIIAKEQKAIEEEILRELEKKKNITSKESIGSEPELRQEQAAEKIDGGKKKTDKTIQRKKTKQKQKKPMEDLREDIEDRSGKGSSETENCDKIESKAKNEYDFVDDDNSEAIPKPRRQSKVTPKSKKTVKSDGKSANRGRNRQNSSYDRSKNRSTSENSKDVKERRSSSVKRETGDEELRTTKSWNKVEEGVGVAIGRRKRAAANQLYYWSSSSDEEEIIEPVATVEEENDRQEQHGWIVGDSHKRMITMLAMEKQLKEKRRRSEDEFEPSKAKNKKHRNSTS